MVRSTVHDLVRKQFVKIMSGSIEVLERGKVRCLSIIVVFIVTSVLNSRVGEEEEHGRMNYEDTKPYMSAFLSVDLLTDFVAFCLTDFIDWRCIHSWFVFSTQLVNCCPHGRRNYILV